MYLVNGRERQSAWLYNNDHARKGLQMMQRLRTGGPVNVRLLVDGTGFGDLGDVVKIDGPDAAHVVALGYGEPTTAKPGKLPRVRESIALVLG